MSSALDTSPFPEHTAELTRTNARLSAEVAARETAERELVRQLQLFRTLVDAIPDSIYIKDAAGRFLMHNAANRRLLELTPGDDGTGRTVFDFPATAANATAYTADDHAVLASGQPVINREESFTQPDGFPGWFLTTKVPVRDADGAVTAIVGVSRDITARRREQQALLESETRFRVLFESSPDAIFVESRAGIVLDANPAACRLHGMTRPELLGQHVTDLVPPERREEVARKFEVLFHHEATILEGESYTLDGRAIPVELAARRCEYGGQVAALIHVRDISERRRAEEELQQARQRQLLHRQRTPLAVIEWDTDFRVIDWNPAAERIFGHTAAEARGQHARFIVPASARGHVDAVWTDLLHQAGGTRSTNENLCRDGTQVVCEWYNTPLINAEGKVIGVASLVEDVTERRRAEADRKQLELKLQETQKLESLGVLAGGIAHDFNNLLTSILGNASLARLDLPPHSLVERSLDRIEQTSLRAADLCKQMLAYAGKGRFVVQPQDLSQLVQDTAHLLQVSISKKAVLKFDLAFGLPPVLADASQLRQIVMNLVINASEAIGDHPGTIALATGLVRADQGYLADTRPAGNLPADDYAFLEVSDTGCGMLPELLARIFDPFYTTKFTGRGLGLAAVLGIVRSHGGALKVHSEPGRGTTFKLLLPIARGAAVAEPPPPRPPADDWRGSGHILVVDDEQAVRAVVARVLGDLGFTVTLAADGREAVALFAAQPDAFTMVVMDLTMPHLDGVEAIAQLRRLRPAVRAVLMSGHSEHDLAVTFADQGVAAFLQKPFELPTLRAKIRRVFETPAK